MSTRNLINDTKPIPIKYTKSYHSFSDPSGPRNRYLFCLELGMKSTIIKNFNKIEEGKYSYIVDIDDNITYKDKDEIKKLGGKWDGRKKSWYFSYNNKSKSKLKKFEKWIPINEISTDV